jgi:hypothetical protein
MSIFSMAKGKKIGQFVGGTSNNCASAAGID